MHRGILSDQDQNLHKDGAAFDFDESEAKKLLNDLEIEDDISEVKRIPIAKNKSIALKDARTRTGKTCQGPVRK